MMAVSRYYIASDQIQRDEGGLKFFVKKTFSPPIYDQGKTVDETLTIWWVGCRNDQYKLGPTFEYRNGQQIGVQSGTYSWTSIQRNTGIPIVENRNRAFDFVCHSSR